MKEPVKINDSDHYKELLEKFRKALLEKLPQYEDAEVLFTRPAELVMMYGGSAVVVELRTKSSGVDKYIVYVDQNQEAQFIRTIEIK